MESQEGVLHAENPVGSVGSEEAMDDEDQRRRGVNSSGVEKGSGVIVVDERRRQVNVGD